MKEILIAFAGLSMLVFGCSVEEAPPLEHLTIHEKPDQRIELRLHWTVNGHRDDGMVADMMLYISRSKDMTDATLDERLSQLTPSYFDFYGNHRIIPSSRYLFHAYRFYVGAAYHGLTDPNADVDFPMNITYTIDVVDQKTGDILHSMEGAMAIQHHTSGTTRIEYLYTMDVIENEPETDYRNYSFRQLAEPITIIRNSDAQYTDTFSTEANLYVELLWTVNGKTPGYSSADLDLFLHDTNDANITSYDDFHAWSLSGDSYEGFRIDPDNAYFSNGIPEKLGLSFYDIAASETPATIEYLYRIYAYDGTIKRYTIRGQFECPPTTPHPNTYYFHAEIIRNGSTYTVVPLNTPLVWQP